jgi:tRNA dimethylallyltransferase
VERIVDIATVDCAKGLFQAIGFKEFQPYFAALHSSETICGDDRQATLLEEGLDKIKRRTRRYARKQISWIQRRLVKGAPTDGLAVHRLEASELDRWKITVQTKASELLRAELSGTPHAGENRTARFSRAQNLQQWRKHVCVVCNGKLLNGDHEWEAHLSSRSHRKRTKRKRHRVDRKGGDHDSLHP